MIHVRPVGTLARAWSGVCADGSPSAHTLPPSGEGSHKNKTGPNRPFWPSLAAKSRRTQPVRPSRPLGTALPPSQCAPATRRVRATHPTSGQLVPSQCQPTTQRVRLRPPLGHAHPPSQCAPATGWAPPSHPPAASLPPSGYVPATRRVMRGHRQGDAQPPAHSTTACQPAST